MDRWQCRDDHCTNRNGFCFVDFAGKHYDIAHEEQLMWSKAIANGDAGVSLERPPTSLYNIWTSKNGAVTQNSRRSEAHAERLEARAERAEKKTFMDRYIRLSEKEFEMTMADRMAEKMDRMSRKKDDQQSSSQPWIQQPIYPSYYPSPQPQWPAVFPPPSSYNPASIQS